MSDTCSSGHRRCRRGTGPLPTATSSTNWRVCLLAIAVPPSGPLVLRMCRPAHQGHTEQLLMCPAWVGFPSLASLTPAMRNRMAQIGRFMSGTVGSFWAKWRDPGSPRRVLLGDIP